MSFRDRPRTALHLLTLFPLPSMPNDSSARKSIYREGQKERGQGPLHHEGTLDASYKFPSWRTFQRKNASPFWFWRQIFRITTKRARFARQVFPLRLLSFPLYSSSCSPLSSCHQAWSRRNELWSGGRDTSYDVFLYSVLMDLGKSSHSCMAGQG